MRAFTTALISAAFLASCGGTAIPAPVEQDAVWARTQWSDATLDTLTRGRAMYANKCGGCHELYAANHRSSAQWPHQVDEMRARAHLDANERDLIVRYLVTAARDHSSDPPASSGSP